MGCIGDMSLKNRNQPPAPLTNPGRCKRCGGNLKWDTEVIEGIRVDSYRCIMCGEEADEVAMERRR